MLPAAVAILLVAAGCSESSDSLSEPATDEVEEPAEVNSSDAANSSDVNDGGTSDVVGGDQTESAADGTAAIAVAAAEALIAVLSDEELAELSYDYGDRTIATSWSNLPACGNNGRAGIRHGDLSDEQVTAVLAVVDAVLSDEGFTNYTQIIAADEELGGGDGGVWDADCYYMAFFGTPSITEPWALQFGGHHYARTVAFADGVTTVTPAFTGVEPRSFTFEGATVEPLAEKSEAIFSIFDTLDDAQLAEAELGSAQTEILLGPGTDSFPGAEGLLLGDASAETQVAVIAAVRQWVDDFEADVADAIVVAIEADLAATTVSWSTSTDIDTQDAYARIDGPSVWIEFINERGVGTSEIHQHSVYRDKTNDYGTAA
ncbi:MAG: DUF3500 domain-containing protein [Acidimicrobiales bacterium]